MRVWVVVTGMGCGERGVGLRAAPERELLQRATPLSKHSM